MDTDFLSIGIDFGTTNSSMAWYNADTEQSEIILNSEGEYKTPSLVYFGEEETLVGKPVEDLLEDSEIYDEAEREDITRRTVRSIKRNLLNPPIISIPGREPVRPVEVVAEILKKLKRDAEEGHFQEEVERAIITCPAVFSAQEWDVVSEAATKARFQRVERLEEPTAAALAVARLGQRIGRNVLVYDLGAGTFDLSVIARDEEDGSFYVPMEPQGDPRCGGDDFDLALYYYCDEVARRELERPISLSEDIDLAFLRQCRRRKENLSSSRRSKFSSLLPSDDGPVRFRHEIDQATFEGLIREQVEDTAKKTAAMVEQAKEQEHEVDTVVLIGGSTRVPLVVQLLGGTLPFEPHQFARKDYAVALGAAYRAQELWGEGQGQKAEEYRRDVEICWQDRKLTRTEAEWLEDLAKRELELSPTAAARVEREVMGSTIAEILERQEQAARERYAKILDLGWKEAKLDVLRRIPPARLEMILDNRDLFVGREFADSPISAEERKEMVGELPWTDFVMVARAAVDPELTPSGTQERLRALADDLGLSGEQAAAIESEVLGSTVKEFRDRRQRSAAQESIKNDTPANRAQKVHSTIRIAAPSPNQSAPPRILLKHKKSVSSVAFSPDGKLLASGSDDQTVQLWRVEDGRSVRTLEGQINVNSVAFSPDGKLLASGGGMALAGNTSIWLWGMEDGAVLRILNPPSPWSVLSVAFSPDGELLASSNVSEVLLWRTEDGELLHTLKTPTWSGSTLTNKVAFSPDGELLLGSTDKNIYLWRVEDGTLLRDPKYQYDFWTKVSSPQVKSVSFSPDGKLLASCYRGTDSKIRLWRPEDGSLLRTLKGYSRWINTVAFSPDGKLLASGSNDEGVRLWRPEDGSLLRTLEGHTKVINTVAFSPDGELLASGSNDGNVWLWQLTYTEG